MDLESLNRKVIACRKCPRLVAWREHVARRKRKAYQDWRYWGKPVSGFGDSRARVVAVGLAPGAHGSNRTGRQFTGDGSGEFLYPSLYRAGYASQPQATSRDDGMTLSDVYLTAAVRCAPPANKPMPGELANCQPYLEHELELIQPRVIVCLGRVAFERIRRMPTTRTRDLKFGHGALYRLDAAWGGVGAWLLCSYHPSQQNTFTRKLTAAMFDHIWARARELSDRA